jgi:hypothetical protein
MEERRDALLGRAPARPTQGKPWASRASARLDGTRGRDDLWCTSTSTEAVGEALRFVKTLQANHQLASSHDSPSQSIHRIVVDSQGGKGFALDVLVGEILVTFRGTNRMKKNRGRGRVRVGLGDD